MSLVSLNWTSMTPYYKGERLNLDSNQFAPKAHCATRYTAKVQPEQIIINSWKGAAPYWEKHREIIRQMFAPVRMLWSKKRELAEGRRCWILRPAQESRP